MSPRALGLVAALMALPFAAVAQTGGQAGGQAGGPTVAQPQVATTPYEAWILACAGEGAERRCEALQNVADPKGQPVLQLRLGPIAPGQAARVAVKFPVDVAAAQPIVWTAGAVTVRLALVACLGPACYGEAPLSGEMLARLAVAGAADPAQFTMKRANGADVVIPLSLAGLADALAAAAP